MKFAEYLSMLREGQDFDRAEAEEFLSHIIENDQITDEQIIEALTSLTKKTVNADEICGFIDAMRSRMIHLPYKGQAIDTCGTGGDKSGTFNISTAAAILLAAGGVPVAKHGNRAATSKCGSADVLEALKVPVDLPPAQAAQRLVEQNFVFLFAPLYHPSLKRLIMIRKQLGFPTVFNLLGPLLNPAGVRRQVIGTFSLKNAQLLAEVASRMDYEHVLILTSDDGLDEASLAAPVNIFEVKGATIQERKIEASDFGIPKAEAKDLTGGDAEENTKIITDAFRPSEKLNAHQNVIIFNAALGFYVSGKAKSIEKGVAMAKDTLQKGLAAEKLKELAA